MQINEQNQNLLLEALEKYTSSWRSDPKLEILNNLQKFVRWIGPERKVHDIKAQELASYGDFLADSAGWQDNTERVKSIKDFLTFCFKQELTHIPLAKHLRVRKTWVRKVPTRSIRPSIDMSEEGHEKMVSELESLKFDRVSVAHEISLAAADKDFRENAPLDAARERQGHLEARIRELEDSLQRAMITDGSDTNVTDYTGNHVTIGSKVTLLDPVSNQDIIYTLVHPSEANPMDFKMSVESPVGKALINHGVGEMVSVNTPAGNLHYLIRQLD